MVTGTEGMDSAREAAVVMVVVGTVVVARAVAVKDSAAAEESSVAQVDTQAQRMG